MPNGRILGFGLNRVTGYFYTIHSGQILKESYRQIVKEEMKHGVRSKTLGWYFLTPDELMAEFEDAVPISFIKDIEIRWSNFTD